MNDLQKLLNKIKKDTQESLENEVANMIKEKIAEHAQTDVYDVYTPNSYRRNYGLSDMDNMKVESGDLEIEVYNDTTYNDKNISEVVETGKGYDYNEANGYPNPPYTYQNERPFISNTIDELKDSKEHIKVLKNVLKNKYYKID